MAWFIVQGRKEDGTRVYYTGCAGEKFISKGRFDAFQYDNANRAQSRAMTLNRDTGLHGVHFTVLISNQEETL